MNDGTEITLSHPEGMSEEELSVIALDEYNKSMGVVFNKNDTVIRDTLLQMTKKRYKIS